MRRRHFLQLVLAFGLSHLADARPTPPSAPKLGRSFDAFEFGCYLSTAVIGRAKGAEYGRFDEQAKDLAKILKIQFPAYPKLAKVPERDLSKAVAFLMLDCKKLSMSFTAAERTAYEIGLKIHVMRVVYFEGNDEGLADVLTARIKTLGLPGDPCKDLRGAVLARAENPQVQQEITGVYNRVRAFLKPKS